MSTQIKMNLGQLPEDTVVADRAFNITSAANAAAGDVVARISPSCCQKHNATATFFSKTILMRTVMWAFSVG